MMPSRATTSSMHRPAGTSVGSSSGRMDTVRRIIHKSQSRKRSLLSTTKRSSSNRLLLTPSNKKRLIRVDLSSDDGDRVERAISSLADDMTCAGGRFSTFQMGGHVAILKAMEEFLECPGIQVEGCRAIEELTSGKAAAAPFIQSIVHAGSIETIIGAMVEYHGNAELQKHAIGALRNLADGGGEEIKCRIARCGTIQTLIDAMRAHRREVEILLLAIETLYELGASEDRRIREAIIICGGVEAIGEASEDHARDRRVQGIASKAIKFLVQHG